MSDATTSDAIGEAVAQIKEATGAKKCWGCGCLHSSLAAIEGAFPTLPDALKEPIAAAHKKLAPVRYDCLGCEVCYPALAVNALASAGAELPLDACSTAAKVEERDGWPPLPGSYTVLRYQAPVAICTLTDEKLMNRIAQERWEQVSLVGTLDTENLGIERLILNVVGNSNVRSLVICGADSKQAVGHLPGQSLSSLFSSGVDERGRIVNAGGKRPILRNVSKEAVEHFRRNVSLVDLIGKTDIATIREAVRQAVERSPGPAPAFTPERRLTPVQGSVPDRMIPDPSGYFVIYPDRKRRLLSLEHYQNDGLLTTIIEGATASEVYSPAVEKQLLSRLDHAAYLGKELARAERALQTGEPYVQDAAPEKRKVSRLAMTSGCGPSCGPACQEEKL